MSAPENPKLSHIQEYLSDAGAAGAADILSLSLSLSLTHTHTHTHTERERERGMLGD